MGTIPRPGSRSHRMGANSMTLLEQQGNCAILVIDQPFMLDLVGSLGYVLGRISRNLWYVFVGGYLVWILLEGTKRKPPRLISQPDLGSGRNAFHKRASFRCHRVRPRLCTPIYRL